jgi:hypothetical protein
VAEEAQPVRGSRGGNSWRSIPAGADVHPGYVTDRWPDESDEAGTDAEPDQTPDD